MTYAADVLRGFDFEMSSRSARVGLWSFHSFVPETKASILKNGLLLHGLSWTNSSAWPFGLRSEILLWNKCGRAW